MIIYHLSNVNIKDKYIRTKFFGLNSYSDLSYNLSKLKRTYFYINLNDKIEYRFKNCLYIYKVKLNKNIKLLNIDKFKKQVKDVYNYAKNLGYDGLISKYNNQVILFKDIKIYKKIRGKIWITTL